MPEIKNPALEAESLTDLWSPRVLAEVDDAYVKVAKIKGEFVWHSHDEEDELFYILKGELKIEFEDGPLILKQGDMYVIPKGVKHNPVAEEECHVMLIERKSTRHTGDVIADKTRSIEEQLRS